MSNLEWYYNWKVPPPPPPQCPLKCRAAVQTGNCDPSCTSFNSICGKCIPQTTPPPPQCPARCRDAISSGNCDPSCNSYSNICGQCIPKTTPPPPPQCPSKCQKAISTGKCDPTCNEYNTICGRCTPTPPPALPGGYLPPPETSRSTAPQLGNSLSLQPRAQFARKGTDNVRSSSGQVSRISRNRNNDSQGIRRGGRKDTRPTRKPRNNWDLYFREGIVKRKG